MFRTLCAAMIFAVREAAGTPLGRDAGLKYLHGFVEEMKGVRLRQKRPRTRRPARRHRCAGGKLILTATELKIIGDTKAAGVASAARSRSGCRARFICNSGHFRSKQTATNKSPHFSAAKRGDNAARVFTKQIHAMQKRAGSSRAMML